METLYDMFELIKRQRIIEKNIEYEENKLSPNPMDYPLEALIQHFFAEVGKFQHEHWHRNNTPIEEQFTLARQWLKAFADVSNLHDMVVAKLKEKKIKDLKKDVTVLGR